MFTRTVCSPLFPILGTNLRQNRTALVILVYSESRASADRPRIDRISRSTPARRFVQGHSKYVLLFFCGPRSADYFFPRYIRPQLVIAI